jgi:AraC family transcriptional activator of pobA
MKSTIPTYSLYGEAGKTAFEFWIHCESIAARSRLYNWEIKDHRHSNFFQILYIRAGTGDAIFHGSTVRLHAGSMVVMPEKVTHGFRFSQDIDGIVITTLTQLLPQTSPADRFLRQFAGQPRVLDLKSDDPDCAYLAQTLLRIGDELAGGFGGRTALIEAYLRLALTIGADLEYPSHQDDEAPSRDLARVARLNELIGTNFRKHLPVEFYAAELGISVTHLNRITRAQTGRTMNELLNEKIMSEAKRDLVFTFMTAQEIAYGLGFADPAYFSRFFSRESGETPRAFRERERKELAAEKV